MTGKKASDMLDQLTRMGAEAGEDPAKLRAVIEAASDFLFVADEVQRGVPALLERAFLAGVDPRDLYGKPYSPGYVRDIYNELRTRHPDLAELPRGPRRRTGR